MHADKFSCESLKRDALCFAADAFFSLRGGPSLFELDMALMEELVSCETLFVSSELDVLQAIISWLQADETRSIEMAEKLADHIRISEMDLADLRLVGKLAAESKLEMLAARCSRAFFNMDNLESALQTIFRFLLSFESRTSGAKVHLSLHIDSLSLPFRHGGRKEYSLPT